jgi:tRNA 5-methylaminomethyl-2-thiouridine biosynthesis bifunctional protein
VIAEAAVVVLANAFDALRLADLPLQALQARRGQVTAVAAPDARLHPRLPVAGGGYALGLPDGSLLLGATSQADDPDAALRLADQYENLARATGLFDGHPLTHAGAALDGRVGWRAATRDRLPLVGPVPDRQAALPARRDAPRLVARRAGLFLLAGLGSRGITSAPLAAELIAAQVCAAPWPLEADLVDAIDPARILLSAQS